MPPPATTVGVGGNIVVDVPPAKAPTKGKAKAAKAEAAVKPEVIDQVARLRNILGKKRAAEEDSLSDSESDGFRPPHNRGNKLRRHAPGAEPGTRASAERLWACHHERGHLENVIIGKRRSVVQKASHRRKVARYDRDEDPYADIKPARILQPSSCPEDLLARPDAARCLQSNELPALECDVMAIIDGEASLNRMLRRATYMIQRDDEATADIEFGKDRIVTNGSADTKPEARISTDDDARSEEKMAREEQREWEDARDLLQAAVAASDEVILRLTAVRSRLVRAQSQKVYLVKRLQEICQLRRQAVQ